VPRADYLAVLDRAFAKWAPEVEADVVQGAVVAVHVGDADHLSAAREFFSFIGCGEVGLGGEFGK
jgi:hypothetical protein